MYLSKSILSQIYIILTTVSINVKFREIFIEKWSKSWSNFLLTSQWVTLSIKSIDIKHKFKIVINLLQRGLHLRHRYPIETSVVLESLERLGYLLAKNYFPIRLSVDIRLVTVDDRTHSQVNFMYSNIQFNHFTHHTYEIHITLSQQMIVSIA